MNRLNWIVLAFIACIAGGIWLVTLKKETTFPGVWKTDYDNGVFQYKETLEVPVVTRHLKRTLHDPSSYESVSWGTYVPGAGVYGYTTHPPGTPPHVEHTFRAKNGFGALGLETRVFILDTTYSTVTSSMSRQEFDRLNDNAWRISYLEQEREDAKTKLGYDHLTPVRRKQYEQKLRELDAQLEGAKARQIPY